MDNPSPRPAAEAGLTLLDQTDPGWWRSDRTPAIDPDALDVSYTTACPVGQLYLAEGYEAACARLGRPGDSAAAFAWERQHGLTGVTNAEDEALSSHWRAVILNRRAMPGIANFADSQTRRRLAEWARWSGGALADPLARWVELTGQGVWWGPFTSPSHAAEFARFITAEVDPATAVPGPPPDGVHLSDPVAELLSWRTMKLAEDCTCEFDPGDVGTCPVHHPSPAPGPHAAVSREALDAYARQNADLHRENLLLRDEISALRHEVQPARGPCICKGRGGHTDPACPWYGTGK